MSKRKSASNVPGPSSSKARMEESDTTAPLATRMQTLLFKEEGADVHFIVGDPEKGIVERIPAIVAILCAASEVFKAMFYGDFDCPKEVDVPDADPKAFKIVLRYIYTDQTPINMDDAIGTLYLAKKYMLKRLVDRTARYIANRLTPENVCLFLDCADVLDDIKNKCWDLIDAKTTEVIHSESFLQLSAKQLADIVKRNTLCVEEIELCERAIEWAQAQLQKDDVDPTPAAIRDALGDTLFSIRFPVMEPEKFSRRVVKTGLLTAEEALEVLLWHTMQDQPKSFICDARAHGRIRLKLDLRALINDSEASPHDSATQKIGDATWSIIALRRRDYGVTAGPFGLGFFVKCHGPPVDAEWRRDAYAVMRVVAQKAGVDDLCKSVGNTFKPSGTDWGFAQFATFESLLDANNGFLIEDKYIELLVDVFAKDCAPPTVAESCTKLHFD